MAVGNPRQGAPAVSLEFDHAAFSYLPGALDAARAGHIPGGLKNNREFVGTCVEFAAGVPPEYRDLLFDPQTSGGLLMAIAPEAATAGLAALEKRGAPSRQIGTVHAKRTPLLFVK
jgi:selenide,water dikinase